MSCILTIDQGNSSAKVTLLDNSSVLWQQKFESITIESLDEVLESYPVRGAIYCSVAGQDVRLIESLRLLLNGDVLVLTPEVPLPVSVEYGSKESLGVDRVALAVGAAEYCRSGESVLVVDAGTAITIDLMLEGQRFCGGNISPGIRMRFAALEAYTECLPLVEPDGNVAPFGTDTQSAIRAGVEWGVAHELTGAFEKALRLYGVSGMIITGGDAPLIQKMLDIPEVEYMPDLMAIGLKRIFEYNEDI